MRHFNPSGEQAGIFCDYCGKHHGDDTDVLSYEPKWPDYFSPDYYQRELPDNLDFDSFMDAQGPFVLCASCDVDLLQDVAIHILDSYRTSAGLFALLFRARIRTLRRLLDDPLMAVRLSHIEGEICYG